MLIPHEQEKKLQDEGRYTELMILQEQLKMYPIGDVWDRYCDECGVGDDASWFERVREYENTVLFNR